MLTALLLSLAMSASSHDEPITIVDSEPSIVILLASYDLKNTRDVDRLERRIVDAAKTVCERSYRDIGYLETVACVKSAMANGKAQLGRLLGRNPSAAGLTSAIAVTVPKD